jgi:hypothetical protein
MSRLRRLSGGESQRCISAGHLGLPPVMALSKSGMLSFGRLGALRVCSECFFEWGEWSLRYAQTPSQKAEGFLAACLTPFFIDNFPLITLQSFNKSYY